MCQYNLPWAEWLVCPALHLIPMSCQNDGETEITFIASMRTALTSVHHLIFCCLFSFTSPIHFFQWPHQLLGLSRKDDVIHCSIKSTHSHFIQLELIIGTTPVTYLIASWCRICMNHLHICWLHILQGWLWWYIDENCMAKDGSTYLCVNAGSVNEWGESDIFLLLGCIRCGTSVTVSLAESEWCGSLCTSITQIVWMSQY